MIPLTRTGFMLILPPLITAYYVAPKHAVTRGRVRLLPRGRFEPSTTNWSKIVRSCKRTVIRCDRTVHFFHSTPLMFLTSIFVHLNKKNSFLLMVGMIKEVSFLVTSRYVIGYDVITSLVGDKAGDGQRSDGWV